MDLLLLFLCYLYKRKNVMAIHATSINISPIDCKWQSISETGVHTPVQIRQSRQSWVEKSAKSSIMINDLRRIRTYIVCSDWVCRKNSGCVNRTSAPWLGDICLITALLYTWTVDRVLSLYCICSRQALAAMRWWQRTALAARLTIWQYVYYGSFNNCVDKKRCVGGQ